jgi:hypothetical protein
MQGLNCLRQPFPGCGTQGPLETSKHESSLSNRRPVHEDNPASCAGSRFVASLATAAELTVLTAGDQNMVDYIQIIQPLFERKPGQHRAWSAPVRDAGRRRSRNASRRRPMPVPKMGHRCRRRARSSPARWSQQAISKPIARRSAPQDGDARECRRQQQCQRLRHADVQQPDGDRLQPGVEANPPKSYENWSPGQKTSQQFGYNRIKGGASGVSFVMGWIYAGDGVTSTS